MRCHVVAVVILALGAGCGPRLSPAERLVDKAAVMISQGNRTDAEQALKEAIAKNPNLPWAHYNLATCQHARRAFDDAIASYRRALELFGPAARSARSACLYGIAAALDEKNEFEKAKKAYEAYLEHAGGAPEESNGVVVARARLEALDLAMAKGLPPGKPLRAPLGAAPSSAPAEPKAKEGADKAGPEPSPAPAPAPKAAPAPAPKAAPAPKPAAPAAPAVPAKP